MTIQQNLTASVTANITRDLGGEGITPEIMRTQLINIIDAALFPDALPPEINGKSVELQTTATHIQWRQEEGTWQNLIALADLEGADGADGAQGPAGADGADGDSAYQIAVAEGFVGDETAWLASLVGPQGPAGADGADGADGAQGPAGADGADGDSAYQIAVAEGFVGDETAWLASLVGPQGPAGADGAQGPAGTGLTNRGTWSADTYQPGDYVFSEGSTAATSMWILSDDTEYVSTLLPKNDTGHWIEFEAPAGADGADGADGDSAYQIAVAEGFVGDETAWLASLVGPQGPAGADGADGADGAQGPAGADGADGDSAYQIAVAEGFVGDETAWFASLVGPQGPAGADGADGADGAQGPAGADGADGDSAYQIAVAEGFVGDETAWLASLVGPQGPAGADGADGADGAQGPAGADGADGDSAYQIAVAEGFVGDETAWLASLVGPQGPAGADGADGADGAQGPAGADGADGADGTNITITVAADQTAYDAATPGATELVVLYSA